ncbi:MmcQ/YjbR family DNA-binding protein [Tumebacillus sp. ITR2]|uniref:MmcQ/YjbR family DNA-binding protein n=1 Tax=Tumebacillus amylolyticus TaxID=2801339 RepID=A0ABS1JD73_9BACL|nr:MmcQ/YjbR family DNA-binding protein [Tumebacillus amylolyticus]MBL0388238.1 MmcQ/YjbR family DNA-binding protein [Tumebacillus amylolyticus]
MKSQKGLELLAKVREISMKLPEVTEAVDSFGHTSFRVTDKPFVMMGENAPIATLAIKTLPTTQDLLLQKAGYSKTPYIGRHGWVSLDTNETIDWQEVQELILEGYLRSAPKRLAKLVL